MPKKKMVPKKTPDASTYSGRFAARLYALRKKAGLSAEQVAEELGTTSISVYNWEKGTPLIRLDMLPKLAELYGFSDVRTLFPKK